METFDEWYERYKAANADEMWDGDAEYTIFQACRDAYEAGQSSVPPPKS